MVAMAVGIPAGYSDEVLVPFIGGKDVHPLTDGCGQLPAAARDVHEQVRAVGRCACKHAKCRCPVAGHRHLAFQLLR